MGIVLSDIDLEKVYISRYNVRSDLGDLTELIDSVTDRGVLEPILVRQRGERYEVIAGSRRVQAARQAGHLTIPAIVLAGTDLEMILTSLIENIHRKDLTLAERVKTYHVLQQLDPDYKNLHSLADTLSRSHQKISHQKISQDFQAYTVLVKLEPYGIRLASDLPPAAAERQSGEVLPEYHAVLLHQAISYLVEVGSVPEEDADEQLVKLARLIAPLSQDAAKATIEEVKGGGEVAAHLFRFKAGRHRSPLISRAKRGEEGGLVTCSCCNRVLKLIHRAGDRHAVVDTPFTHYPMLPAPEFPDEPAAQ